MDELLWAGLWLYKATGDEGYLNYVIENAHVFGGITWAITEFSWDVKYAGVQLIASMVQICLSISFSLSLIYTYNMLLIHTKFHYSYIKNINW